MFTGFWILWSIIGLALATALFAWSVKTRQFENSRRAALIPFDDVKPDAKNEGKPVKKNRLLFWTVMFLLVLSLAFLVGTVMMTLTPAK
jgi:nitrogen fixation-related uncharacterized protein